MRTSQAVIAMAFILLMRVEAFAFSSCVRGARPARCLSILQAIDQDGQAQAAVGKVEPTHFNGTTHSSSEFITHFIAGAQPGLTVESAVQSLLPRQDLAAGPQQHRDMLLKNEDDTLLARAHPSLRHSTLEFPSTGEPLSAVELLAIGSTWYLSKDSPRDPALGGKPTRLTLADAGKILEEGDYLRVHNPPRRFPAVNLYDWGRLLDEDGSKAQLDRLPGVVVAEDEEAGYIIIDKPAGLPVHGTVDNTLENVSAAVGRALLKKREADLMESIRNTAKYSSSTLGNERDYRKRKRKGKQKEEPLVYVSTPQRLDQNTSGLFVVSTKKQFASYFAALLRQKTGGQLSDVDRTDCSVHKRYRCLVCLSQKDRSMADELARLRKWASEGKVIRHWLEPSIKAPKNFALVSGNSTWSECLLRINHVGEACAIIGNDAAHELSDALWISPDARPKDVVGVVEVEIELLTGRTHQIRGQMSASGFPLCGDVGYGGAIPQSVGAISGNIGFQVSEKLALQCCQLEFVEADFSFKAKKNDIISKPSCRWKTFRLETAWWTPLLKRYASTQEKSATYATFATEDEGNTVALKNNQSPVSTRDGAGNTLLPPRVKLAPGKNKYVIVKASRLASETIWFVRSESPHECGGPYHADVARSLVEELTSLGYVVKVTGGGRIDYVEPHAHVNGFSYGFGKGDHALAAQLIEDFREEIYATHADRKSVV